MKNKFFVTRKYYDRVTRELTNKILEQKRRIEYLGNLTNTHHEIARLNKIRTDDLYNISSRVLDDILSIIHDIRQELEDAYYD